MVGLSPCKFWQKKYLLFLALMVLATVFILVAGSVVAKPEEAKTYVGSAQCKECHDRIYSIWKKTLHANVIQDVRKKPSAIKGDFTTPDKVRTFKKSDVIYTHGNQWKQRYINKKWQVLPAQWNFETEKWAPYNVEKWKEEDWRAYCGYCHTTGFDRNKLTWKEFNVGCEACHGPGSKHVENRKAKREQEEGEPEIINPAGLPARLAADVCGQCHTRGKSPDGIWPFPVNFKPGDQIKAENFVPVPKTDPKAWWPDGSVRLHRQQWIEWKESKHARAGVICTTCHDPHEATTKFQTRLSQNNLCLGCHSNVSTDAVSGHAPIGGTTRQHADCVGCHMSRVGKSAEAGDEVVHHFRMIAPVATLTLGGGDVSKQPNTCNVCHPGAPPAALNEDLAERLPFRARRAR